MSFTALWSQTGSFRTLQSCQFLNMLLFRSWCGNESCLMTQRVLHRVQVGDMGFLQRVYGMTLRNKVRSCEISKTLNVKPLFQIERSELHWFSHVTKMSQERLARQVKSCWLHQWEGSEKVMLAAGRVTTSLTLLGRSRTIWYCCWPWGISNPSCPCDPLEKKSGHENELAKHAANLVITFTSIGQPIIIGCSSTFFLTTITVW